MKKIFGLMAMSAMLYASGGGSHDQQRLSRHVPKKYKGESKKCKSCELFPCKGRNQDPMQMACDSYKKK